MRKEHYLEILQEEVLPSRNNLVGEKFIFQHDNDPKNTAKVCKEFLNKLEDENKLELMIWPPQSPDLNPIELLWDELDRYVRKQSPGSKEHLWELFQEEWQKISSQTLEKLISRMPRLCNAVIKADGVILTNPTLNF